MIKLNKVSQAEMLKLVEAKFKSRVALAKIRLLNDLRAATPVDTGKARDGWHYVGNKLVNPVDYITELNNGHSQQAPRYFIEQAILNNKLFRIVNR